MNFTATYITKCVNMQKGLKRKGSLKRCATFEHYRVNNCTSTPRIWSIRSYLHSSLSSSMATEIQSTVPLHGAQHTWLQQQDEHMPAEIQGVALQQQHMWEQEGSGAATSLCMYRIKFAVYIQF